MEQLLRHAIGWRGPRWLLDATLYGSIAVVDLVAITADDYGTNSRGALLIVMLVDLAVLACRRRAPLFTLAGTLAVAILVDQPLVVTLPVLLAVFTIAESGDRDVALAASVGAIVALSFRSLADDGQAVTSPLISLRVVAVGMVLVAGLYVRVRARYVNGLQERAGQLERERELVAQQAVGDERVRIARELHDVVAHNVSLMVVQAQALAATGDESPDRLGALGTVAALGREAMAEMHRMLGVLRVDGDDAATRAPQPSITEIGTLVSRAADTGLRTRLVFEGARRELAPAIELSAYRIVQEAITNVVRHAGATQVDVILAYQRTQLTVVVEDDGRGASEFDPGGGLDLHGGHGLVGMRERAALFDGVLEAGPRADGQHGYRIRATLPTG